MMRPTASTGSVVDTPLGRQRLVLLLSMGTLTGLAWLALVSGSSHLLLDQTAILAPRAQEPDLTSFLLAVSMWMVMMVAMMLPPVMPWLLLFGSLARKAYARPLLASALFGAGYFAVWFAYSLMGAVIQLGLQRRALLGLDLRLHALLGGALLLAAGLFQLTPLKHACLAHCRNPLSFFLARWQDGPTGPFRMGSSHGIYCLGCCWALMGVSFALGLMNLLWMAALTLIICIEKLAPRGQQMSRAFGLAFGGWGLWLMLAGSGLAG